MEISPSYQCTECGRDESASHQQYNTSASSMKWDNVRENVSKMYNKDVRGERTNARDDNKMSERMTMSLQTEINNNK